MAELTPRTAKVDDETKKHWVWINKYLMERGGVTTSLPGRFPLTFRTQKETTTLPGELRERGYDVHNTGTSEVISPIGTVETLVDVSSGQPFTFKRRHPGVVRTQNWRVEIPPWAAARNDGDYGRA